jgi:Bacteriophage probable baseplate hub protein
LGVTASITPDYRIINKTVGKDITADLKPYMIALSLTESADNQNDTLSVSMNGQGINQFPPSGTKLEVHLGYKETGLASFGIYKVDTKTLSGMPLILNIKAGSSDFNSQIKTQKSVNFDNKPLGDILAAIANNNGLELVISPTLSSKLVPYLRQDQESDMQLVKRLAREHSADGTIKSGKLVFKEKSKPAQIRTITPGDLIDFRITWIDRPKYDKVIATWHDRDTNTASQVIYDGKAFVGDTSGNIARVTPQSNSLVEAQKAAKAHWSKLNNLQLKASLNMVGDTTIVSKMGLKLSGFTPDTDGTILYVFSVRHEIGTGYKTDVEATNQADQ